MRRVAIIQARMGSRRLPGKVLQNLQGKPVLEHIVKRLQSCKMLDEVVVATTIRDRDDKIADFCQGQGIVCFRGSEDDVLDRFYRAAEMNAAATVVRITADCPLIDPGLLDQMLNAFTDHKPPVDYLSNTLNRTFPRGLDVEIFTFAALTKAWRGAEKPAEREHVTPYIYSNPEKFSCVNFSGKGDFSDHRWTLDTPEDWRLIEEIYGRLYRCDSLFSTAEVLELMCREAWLQDLNCSVMQKELG